MFFLALYVGEGDKANPGRVGMANADYRVLQKFLKGLALFGVPRRRLKLMLHVHDPQQIPDAMKHWCSMLGVVQTQFTKPYTKPPRSNTRRRNKHPNGICTARVGDTQLRQKLGRWMELALAQ